jgi:hypothetical protein
VSHLTTSNAQDQSGEGTYLFGSGSHWGTARSDHQPDCRCDILPGEEPLGQRIFVGVDPSYELSDKSIEIVGVVGDVRYGG